MDRRASLIALLSGMCAAGCQRQPSANLSPRDPSPEERQRIEESLRAAQAQQQEEEKKYFMRHR